MRRIALLLVGTWALQAGRLGAQAHDRGWSLAVVASLTGFRGAASDTSSAGDLAIRPGQAIALSAAVARRWGPWAMSIGAGYLPTHVEAVSSEVALQERQNGLERVRLSVAIARRLARAGSGGVVEIRAGPTLDHWSIEGNDGRLGAGGEAAFALQLPVGALTVEQVLSVGWSAGPFRTAELPAGYRREALRTLTMGLGVRFGW